MDTITTSTVSTASVFTSTPSQVWQEMISQQWYCCEVWQDDSQLDPPTWKEGEEEGYYLRFPLPLGGFLSAQHLCSSAEFAGDIQSIISWFQRRDDELRRSDARDCGWPWCRFGVWYWDAAEAASQGHKNPDRDSLYFWYESTSGTVLIAAWYGGDEFQYEAFLPSSRKGGHHNTCLDQAAQGVTVEQLKAWHNAFLFDEQAYRDECQWHHRHMVPLGYRAMTPWQVLKTDFTRRGTEVRPPTPDDVERLISLTEIEVPYLDFGEGYKYDLQDAFEAFGVVIPRSWFTYVSPTSFEIHGRVGDDLTVGIRATAQVEGSTTYHLADVPPPDEEEYSDYDEIDYDDFEYDGEEE